MKQFIRDFLRRGLVALGFGPMVLAVLYLILYRQWGIQTLTVTQVCTGIFSLSCLAFLAGGMNAIYQVERIPLMIAILIHGLVLYAGYLAAYLVNGWLEWGVMPILVFTGIFGLGYLAIWAMIYSIIRSRTRKLNELLLKKQQLPKP